MLDKNPDTRATVDELLQMVWITNKGKEQMDAGLLKTRTAQSGRIYVRLPDGTLKMTKTAEDRAAELASFGNKE